MISLILVARYQKDFQNIIKAVSSFDAHLILMNLELLNLYYHSKRCDHAVWTFKGTTQKDVTMNSQIDF